MGQDSSVKKDNKAKYIVVELGHHFPYSIMGAIIALILMGILTFFAVLMRTENLIPKATRELFHILHPVHILFSSVATTAMFWKHQKKLAKAVMIGFFGSILICGISDIILPFWGGIILGFNMTMHVCMIEKPLLILTFAIVGILAGLLVTKSIEHSTEYSHSTHVLISSLASISYLLAYGLQYWTYMVGGVFIITVLAVMVPCCASDIAFPLYCINRKNVYTNGDCVSTDRFFV
ncbi:MAG: hypothetical protein JSU83_22070 [Deltaproteobacteria bacterium]|nr:MAG: hypothetical protein JSU83_22070 [Deltaproteobacteria bacterium]